MHAALLHSLLFTSPQQATHLSGLVYVRTERGAGGVMYVCRWENENCKWGRWEMMFLLKNVMPASVFCSSLCGSSALSLCDCTILKTELILHRLKREREREQGGHKPVAFRQHNATNGKVVRMLLYAFSSLMDHVSWALYLGGAVWQRWRWWEEGEEILCIDERNGREGRLKPATNKNQASGIVIIPCLCQPLFKAFFMVVCNRPVNNCINACFLIKHFGILSRRMRGRIGKRSLVAISALFFLNLVNNYPVWLQFFQSCSKAVCKLFHFFTCKVAAWRDCSKQANTPWIIFSKLWLQVILDLMGQTLLLSNGRSSNVFLYKQILITIKIPHFGDRKEKNAVLREQKRDKQQMCGFSHDWTQLWGVKNQATSLKSCGLSLPHKFLLFASAGACVSEWLPRIETDSLAQEELQKKINKPKFNTKN